MKSAHLLALLIGASTPIPSFAYDTSTHAVMTSEALAKSKFTRDASTSALTARLGIRIYDWEYTQPDAPFSQEPFGKIYYDMGPNALTKRTGLDFETKIMELIRRQKTVDATGITIDTDYSLAGWFMRGAIREDDNTIEIPNSDEPGGVFSRVFGHFYDPVNDRPLAFPSVDSARAPDWALDATVRADSRENHFKVSDAREAMWRALTLKKKNADGSFSDLGNFALRDVDEPAAREDARKAYWATTFRAMGDVVHVLQDMAQPQHTRNDPHSGLGCIPGTGSCAGGHDSFYEKYIKARTLGLTGFWVVEGITPDIGVAETQKPFKLRPLVYDSYTFTPTFTRYRDFFSTATAGANADGLGMANYSNRGFYSFGTNIYSLRATDFPSPHPLGGGLGDDSVTGPAATTMAGIPLPDGAKIRFKTGTVLDKVSGAAEPNVKLSTVGMWDQFLESKGFLPGYTLNVYNYDDQARLLIPRAVAYSAGLIDHFFRGALEIGLPDEGVYAAADYSDAAVSTKDTGGFRKIKLKLTNKTETITPSGGGTALTQTLVPSGTVVAIAKFRRNRCYVPGSMEGEWAVKLNQGASNNDILTQCRGANEEIVVSDPISLPSNLEYGNTVPLTFTFPQNQPIPINATDLFLQVVYRGYLGMEEDAIAVGTRDISETNYIRVADQSAVVVSDPITLPGGGTCFTKSKVSPLTRNYGNRFEFSFSGIEGPPYLGSVTTYVNDDEYAVLAVLAEGKIKLSGRILSQKGVGNDLGNSNDFTLWDTLSVNGEDPRNRFDGYDQLPSFINFGRYTSIQRRDAKPRDPITNLPVPLPPGTLFWYWPEYRKSQIDFSTKDGRPALDGGGKMNHKPLVRGLYTDQGFTISYGRGDICGLADEPEAGAWMQADGYLHVYPQGLNPKKLDQLNF